MTVHSNAFWSQACSWAIDALKTDVPIWKKEFFEDGSIWKENSESLHKKRTVSVQDNSTI